MLSPTERALVEPLRHGEPVPIDDLINSLYGSRYDGGPDDAANTIHQMIFKARRKLAKYQIVIVTVGTGRGSHGWMVDPAHRDALAALIGKERAARAELPSGASNPAPGGQR